MRKSVYAVGTIEQSVMQDTRPTDPYLRHKVVMQTSIRRVTYMPQKPGFFRFLRAKKQPKWKVAEVYFRTFRDPKMKVTLPRLNLPEYEEDAA